MTQVLVTGFEPFGGFDTNPSQQVAQQLAGRDGWHTATLPVDFAECGKQVAELIAAHQPQVVLCLGLAGGTSALELERVAINLIDARIPDNVGSAPVDEPVVAGAPDAYFTTLPVKAMARAINDVGVPAELSLSAGTYGCNAVMYAALHAATATQGVRAGFMHLPTDDVISVPDAARAVVAAVDCALATDVDEIVAGGTLH